MQTGTRLCHYEILSAIGKGGMGEVWRARDTKLGREVAIKTLPEEFARDADRLARFEREAKVLASLNHPNIAAIHGFEQDNGTHFLVLELVAGETLADRLQSGAIPLEDSITLALQIAQALAAAHEKGVIHRDLKPANIKVTDHGKVKVLDFGLAKAFAGAEFNGNPSNSPTLSMAATQQGVILGTAAYMSPEQARGKAVDKRSDVWAFGCVLYEMLTGRRAFEGDDISDTLANVLKSPPDWSALPPGLPASVRAVVTMCLEKDRQQRMADISVAQFLLGPQSHVAPASVAPQAPSQRRLALYALAALLVGAIIAGAGTWLATRPEPRRVERWTIMPPSTAALTTTQHPVAITPDGRRIVYTGAGGTQIFVRALDQIDAIPITGLGAPRDIFLSPDGQWIGFFDGTTGIKKVAITGGPPFPIAQGSTPGSRGASWSEDGTIVFATGDPTTGLFRVPAGGGEPAVLTTPDRAAGENDHLFPRFLPGGQSLFFTITYTTGGNDSAKVAVLDLRTGKYKTLVPGSEAHYLSSGHLVFAAAGSLLAAAFDLDRLEMAGTPVPVVPQVMQGGLNLGFDAKFAVSRDGTLVYVPGGVGEDTRTLAWVDRKGHEEPINAEPRAYMYPRLSPDGTQVALDVRDRQLDIWIWTFSQATLTRLTSEGGLDAFPVWTPNGRVIFGSAREGPRNLFWQAANNTGAAARLSQSSTQQQDPYALSPDGTLVFKESSPKTGWDLKALVLDKPDQVRTLVSTASNEVTAALTHDGRWLAYQSDESGRDEIYVRPFPDVDSNRWTISTGGGTMPVWSRSGDELFYVSLTRALMRVPIRRSAGFSFAPPEKLFDWPYQVAVNPNNGHTYDISLDGSKFLVIKNPNRPDQAAPASITVVQNWFEELKGLVPVP